MLYTHEYAIWFYCNNIKIAEYLLHTVVKCVSGGDGSRSYIIIYVYLHAVLYTPI